MGGGHDVCPHLVGVVYVVFVLDVYSRMIADWQAAHHMRTELLPDA
ncbi:hypothetical protein ACFT8W_17490 [Streptomyces hygroscopicus]